VLNIHKIRENLIFDNLIGNFYGFCSTEGFLDCVENSLGKIKIFEKMIFMIISNYLKCIEDRKRHKTSLLDMIQIWQLCKAGHNSLHGI